MGLPNSYTVKSGALGSYFDAIKGAQPPDRFSVKFLENLEFKSTNDRTVIAILKELKFLDSNGVPSERYFKFLDNDISEKILAEGIKEMYSDLFAIKTDAHTLSSDQVIGKLKTLYKGSKKETVIKLIAKTFIGLCELADFTPRKTESKTAVTETEFVENKETEKESQNTTSVNRKSGLSIDALQYQINIILPDTRDQAVYDSIFKSLREHLG